MPPKWTKQQKLAAISAVARAVKEGHLVHPSSCEACGSHFQGVHERSGRPSDIVLHHHSYAAEHQLDVIPLCRPCHQQVHSGAIPEPRTGRVYKAWRRGAGVWSEPEAIRHQVWMSLRYIDRGRGRPPFVRNEIFKLCLELRAEHPDVPHWEVQRLAADRALRKAA